MWFYNDMLWREVCLFGSRMLPGALASFLFDVITTTITVFMRLRLKSSDCITMTGLRCPGVEPVDNENNNVAVRMTMTGM